MTTKSNPVTSISGTVIVAQNQTVAEVSGSSHQGGVVGYSANGTGVTVGGGGSGHVSTSLVNIEKGAIERYSDGHEVSYSLRMEPFLRVGEDAALIRADGVCIGVAKLKTGQWRAEHLEFGRFPKVKRRHSVIAFFTLPGTLICLAFGVLLGSFLCAVVLVSSYYATKSKLKEIEAKNRDLITAEVEAARKKWADRIGKGVASGEIRAMA